MLIETKLKRWHSVRPLLNVSLYQLLMFHPSVQNEEQMRDMNLCKSTRCWIILLDVSTWLTE
jgi:hypothetical protein